MRYAAKSMERKKCFWLNIKNPQIYIRIRQNALSSFPSPRHDDDKFIFSTDNLRTLSKRCYSNVVKIELEKFLPNFVADLTTIISLPDLMIKMLDCDDEYENKKKCRRRCESEYSHPSTNFETHWVED